MMDDFQTGLLDGLQDRGREIAEGVAAWARDAQPLLESSIAYVTTTTPPLPAVIVEVTGFAAASPDDERFPGVRLQEIDAIVYDVQVLLGVSNDDENAADEFLKRTAARLRGSAWYDATLGGRVPLTSRQITAEFGDLFVEYGDGVRARAAAMTFAVADIETEGTGA